MKGRTRFLLATVALVLSLGMLGCAVGPGPTPVAPPASTQADAAKATTTTDRGGDPTTAVQASPADESVIGLDGEEIPASPPEDQEATGTTPIAETPTGRLGVPYLSQLDNELGPEMSCGPTCLSMVMKYYGKDVSPDRLTELCERDPENGVEMYQLEEGAKKAGFPNARTVNQATMEDLEEHIAKGNPVIVACMNPDGESSHAMVVVGFDENGDVLLNDPYPPDHALVMNRSEFYDAWYNYNQCEYVTLK